MFTITKDATAGSSRLYRARLSNAARMTGRHLVPVAVDVPNAYGSTVAEAIRALDARFDAWRRAIPTHTDNHSVQGYAVTSSPSPASRRTTFPASSASRSLTARPRIVASRGLRSRGAAPLPCAVEADAAEYGMRRRLGPSDFAGNAEHSRDGVVAKRQDGAPMLAARARNVDVAVNQRIGGNTDSHPAHLGNLK
jgi:hypothetical protein